MFRSFTNGEFEVLTSESGCDIYLTAHSYSILSGKHKFDVAKRIQERWLKLGLVAVSYDTPNGVGKKWLIPISVVNDWMLEDNPNLLAKITYMQSLREYILSQVA